MTVNFVLREATVSADRRVRQTKDNSNLTLRGKEQVDATVYSPTVTYGASLC